MTIGSRLVDGVFAVCCVALAAGAAVRWVGPEKELHAAREDALGTGTADPFGVPSAARPRLYVLLSSSCRVCTESLPFYRQLTDSARASGGAELIFAGVEPEASLRTYLAAAAIRDVKVVSVMPRGVPGTPTIVSLDARGRVLRSWAGRLSRRQERDVLAVFAVHGQRRGAVPSPVDALLAKVRARLSATRNIDTVAGLELAGSETTLFDTGARESPYAVTLQPPALLELRSGPIVHTLRGGEYTRRIADPGRFGGPVVDRLLTDPTIINEAAHGMRSHLLRLSLTYLARAPTAPVVEDEGFRDFGGIKGRTIVFKDPAAHIQSELVADPVTFDLLGVVTPVQTVSGGGAGSRDGSWISLPGDYRDVGGVRVPHRIEDWIAFTHVRVSLTSVKVR